MSDQPAYQVLARKYCPATFADLIGQEAMVRTLKNAFAADRIASLPLNSADAGRILAE
jgi:DNA polymerase III subunit gamma/tau